MTDHVDITINTETLGSVIKSNISCHVNKTLTQELIDDLSKQIVESINYFLNNLEGE